MDTRPYTFSLVNGSWSFIAFNSDFTPSVPIELWESESETGYVLCRMCYTKEMADMEIKKALDPYGMKLMEGPDLYVILKCIEGNQLESVACVWFPPYLGGKVIELQVTSKCSSLINSDSTIDNIRETFGKLINEDVKRVQKISEGCWHVINT